MSDLSWTQPACDECWFARHPNRQPHRVVDLDPETCCFCGNPTSGLFVRVNPNSIPHPTWVRS